jgi:hypothetical protein
MPPQPASERGRTTDPGRTYRAVLDELLYIRKEAGFVPARIPRAPLLRHLLGGETEPFATLRERLESAIHSLHDSELELLLDVFRLSAETVDLQLLGQRRAYYGAKHALKPVTVADHEVPAIEHLRTQLTTGWYPKSPVGLRVPMSHNGAVNEFVSVTCVIADRKWQETRERYRFVAAFDEADFLAISRSKPGLVIAEGDFTVKTVRIGESYTHRFYAREPMRRGRAYDLNFKTLPDPEIPDDEIVVEESRAFHEPTRFATFAVVFRGRQPRAAWAYRGLSFFERPGEPAQGQLLNLRTGKPVVTFRDLYGGLHSGVAWKW